MLTTTTIKRKAEFSADAIPILDDLFMKCNDFADAGERVYNADCREYRYVLHPKQSCKRFEVSEMKNSAELPIAILAKFKLLLRETNEYNKLDRANYALPTKVWAQSALERRLCGSRLATEATIR